MRAVPGVQPGTALMISCVCLHVHERSGDDRDYGHRPHIRQQVYGQRGHVDADVVRDPDVVRVGGAGAEVDDMRAHECGAYGHEREFAGEQDERDKADTHAAGVHRAAIERERCHEREDYDVANEGRGDDILHYRQKQAVHGLYRYAGKCCVLTNTNDEALQILGLLLKNGVRAKLIQSLDGFRLYNLLELRFFLKQIDQSLKSPVISNDLWNRAKKQLFEAYSGSPCLEICKNLLRDFEAINPTKYRTDLEEFIKESNYEDFYDDEREVIYVSTIHKAKGREFDAVYLMLSGNTAISDEEKRKLYVGMTRAKDSLYIHCNTNLFSAFDLPGIARSEDNNEYGEPEEISLQLTHKDVVLDFFKDKKEVVFQLKSGIPLFLTDAYLSAELNGRSVRIAKFSKACRERLQTLHERGYIPYSASIRFIVAWKGEDDTEETAVVLPDIYLRK